MEILFDAIGHIAQLKGLQPDVQVETNLQNDLIPINQILDSLLEEACDWVCSLNYFNTFDMRQMLSLK